MPRRAFPRSHKISEGCVPDGRGYVKDHVIVLRHTLPTLITDKNGVGLHYITLPPTDPIAVVARSEHHECADDSLINAY